MRGPGPLNMNRIFPDFCSVGTLCNTMRQAPLGEQPFQFSVHPRNRFGTAVMNGFSVPMILSLQSICPAVQCSINPGFTRFWHFLQQGTTSVPSQHSGCLPTARLVALSLGHCMTQVYFFMFLPEPVRNRGIVLCSLAATKSAKQKANYQMRAAP